MPRCSMESRFSRYSATLAIEKKRAILRACLKSRQQESLAMDNNTVTVDSIIRKDPDKQHLVLDYAACERLYATFQRELNGKIQELDGETIGSPFDIYSVETIRKRFVIEEKLGTVGNPKTPGTMLQTIQRFWSSLSGIFIRLRHNRSLPTDVFVWGEGEPEKPYLTKIGGLPYLPKELPYPTDANGQPYIFVAQICFVDSKDIVPLSLPGDVLLIFVKHDGWDGEYLQCHEPDDMHFEWIRIADQPLWNPQTMKENGFRSVEPTFFGVIHRTLDYKRTDEIYEKLCDTVGGPYLIHGMSATKIGGIPVSIQYGLDDFIAANDATYFGQFVSLQFEPDVPFPWCNRKESIGDEFGTDDSIYAKGKSLMIGDMGSIYLSLKPDGTIAWYEECY